MEKTTTRPRRCAGLAAIGTLVVLLAGCEDRMADEVGMPRPRPDRTAVTAQPKAAPRIVLPTAYAYRPDPYRSNCAPSRC